jgi:hypothetical protein
MSEHLAAAAATLNAPEAMVKRSAEARAKATGTPVDDILAAWAGGGSAPAPVAPATAAPAPAPEADPVDPAPPAQPASTPAPASSATPTAEPSTPAPAAVGVITAVRPSAPPVLEAKADRPLLAMVGAMSALALALLAGLAAPTGPVESNGVFSSALPLSAEAEAGREVYRSMGCGSCHTAVVRPLAIDAGLGPVTIADANQELGYRRLGPDLSNVANRVENASMYASALSGAGGHPAYTGLTDEDVANLVAYLSAANFTPEESTEEETES